MMKAVISTKEAYEYVGNQMIWKELIAAYPDLKPIRTASRGDQFWKVSEIDKYLDLAQISGVLRGEAA